VQLRGLPLDGLFLQIQIDEYRNFGFQNVGIERLENEVDRPEGVGTDQVGSLECDRSDKDNRDPRAVGLLDEFGGFQPVHPGHPDIHQDYREIFFSKSPERFFAGNRANEPLPQWFERCFKRN
jgi:hypothetical protein